MKKLGLALGAGGAKGLAHIGVLQVFKEKKLKVDMIAGSSMGALIGAAYASGTDIDLLAKLASTLQRSLFIDVNIPRVGLLKGEKVLGLIRLLTHNKEFSELHIPLAVVATDIEKGEPVVFREEGDVAQAVRASISIPGIFNPVRAGDRLLVDGAVTERLPVSILKEMGADYVVAVDVKACPAGERIKIQNIYDIIMHSIEILENKACKESLEAADFLITPDTKEIGTTEFHKAEECVEAGRIAAEAIIEEIMIELAGNRKAGHFN
ncbi:MAG: patatin-like phospholipase family protein [Peptococcaceae bacterium]|nr:patatin-like phospholipase family protein [Peptococcaceae bacterium]MDH7525476.1 patatin-like phospholipase family protein [Peptococcaceae bacterium]